MRMKPPSKQPRWQRRGMMAALAALLTACMPTPSLGNRFMSQQYRAEDFFRGHYLEMAKAIETGDMPRLKQLAQGQDLLLKGEQDMDLLWFAILREQFDAISALIALGVNPDAQIAQGLGSALEAAFQKQDDPRFLRAMLDGGLDPNHRYPQRKLMLQRGVAAGLAHVQLLLARGTRINDQDSIGANALYEAINRVKPDIAAYLIEQGADVHAPTVNGVTPAWSIHESIEEMRPGQPVRAQFEQLRERLIRQGETWPPLTPAQVRVQMQARGDKVVMPKNPAR